MVSLRRAALSPADRILIDRLQEEAEDFKGSLTTDVEDFIFMEENALKLAHKIDSYARKYPDLGRAAGLVEKGLRAFHSYVLPALVAATDELDDAIDRRTDEVDVIRERKTAGRTAAEDVAVTEVEYASGQEPGGPDDVCTLVRAGFTVGGAALVRLLGCQARVLDARLAQLVKDARGRRTLLNAVQNSREILQAVKPAVLRWVANELSSEFGEYPRMTADWAEESDLPYVARIDLRARRVEFEVELDVLGKD